MPGLLLALSIAAGIVLAERLDASARVAVALVPIGVGASALGVVALAIGRHRIVSSRRASRRSGATRSASLVRGLCLIGAAGFAFASGYDALARELDRAALDGLRVEAGAPRGARLVEARVAERRSGRWGDRVILRDVRAIDGGSAAPRSVLLRLEAEATSRPSPRAARVLAPGERVRLGLRLAPLRARRNPGSPDRERAWARRGLAAQARLVDDDWVVVLESDGASPRAALARARSAWRHRVATRLAASGPSSGLARVLALGDRSGVSPDTHDAFARLGLAHLLAVSGLHVGLVAALVGALAVLARVPGVGGVPPFDVALVLAWIGASLYAWLTQAGVSVERAALLFGLHALCRLARRRLTPPNALAWVAAVLLLASPAALFDLGARLSFAACAGLILAGVWSTEGVERPSPEAHHGALRSVARVPFQASLAASLGTLPMLLGHDLPAGIVSPWANVLAIPWTGLVALPCALLAALAAPLLPAWALTGLLWPAAMLERTALAAASMLPPVARRAGLPWSVCLILVITGLLAARRGRWRVALAVWIGVVLAGTTPFDVHSFGPPPPRIVFFDVGQGDAALVQGTRATLLVDTGPGPADGSGGEALVRGLRAAGVDAIDVLAVSHTDLDHRGGTERVLASFAVGELWLPAAAARETAALALARAAARRGAAVRWVAAGAHETPRGDLAIGVLWPPADGVVRDARSGARGARGRPRRARNAGSMVLRVVMDEAVLVFAADIGAREEAALVARDARRLGADLLKVAHHGSRSSSSRAFLDAVDPSVAIVSAPCEPSRGLPAAAALDRVDARAGALWWTGRDGAVIVAPRRRAARTNAAKSRPGSPTVATATPAPVELRVRGWGAPRTCAWPPPRRPARSLQGHASSMSRSERPMAGRERPVGWSDRSAGPG
jgi:competence protein ComEC